jgi:class 3 adenylate cyclase/tetratricopeptide (TPR) repeat protein
MHCQKCGSENPDNSKFCNQCGYILSSTNTPQMSNTVANHLPSQIGERTVANKHQSEGERKVITVLFADVVNYTSLVEEFDVEIVQGIMNSYFKALMDIVYKYEGVVAQLLGDGMMVFFGAPIAHEDHAQRACYSAMVIQTATRNYSEKLKQQYGIDFSVRVGINSGPVFVGTIGNDLHMEYLAIGNTVNLASRIQTAATPRQTLVSSNTHHLVKYFFNFETIKALSIKGREEPIDVYELLDAKKEESRFDAAVVTGLSRFCGHQDELAILNKALSEVEKRNCRIVSIVGEPGIGKSRLIRQFRESLTPDEGTFFEGRCLHYGNSIPYRPFIDILRSFFNIEEGDTESRMKEKIIAKVRHLDERMVDDLPFIFEILSLKIEDKSYFNIEPEHRRNKMFITTTRLLVKESLQQSVIVVIEDLHWIDDVTEELLAHLILKLENCPVLFLLSYRPEYSLSWKNQPGYMQIHLSQLSASSSDELLQSLLPDGELAPEITALVLAKAGGNPLFVEEYTYALLEKGEIQKDDGHYSLTSSPTSIKLPDTLQGIISSRIDRLPENLKNTLQVASVIGRDFGYEVLRTVMQKPQRLRNQLEKLQDLELIVTGGTLSETEYSFKHALIQEVAYGELSGKKQQELHENVGRTIERLYSDRLEELLDILAYHFGNGLSQDKALDYFIRAGNKAKAVFANSEAIEYFKKALELCPKYDSIGDGIGANLHETLQEIYMLTGKYDQALDSYENSFRLGEQYEESASRLSKGSTAPSELLSKHLPDLANKQERLANLYYRRSHVCIMKMQTDEGLNWVDKGLVLSEISDRIKARLLCAKSNLNTLRSEYTLALDCCWKAIEYAHDIQDEIEASAYCLMGYIHNQLGNVKIQADYYQRALDIAIRLQKPELEAEALDSLAICFNRSDDWKRAEMYYKKSLSISEKIGSVNMQLRTLTNYSDLLIRRGHVTELEEAIACNIKALDMYFEGCQITRHVIYANLAWAWVRLGNLQKAREYGDKSLTALEHGWSKYWFCQGYLTRAEVHFSSGETEAALDLCRKSLDIAIEVKSILFQGESYILMGKIYHRLGQWDKAEEMLKDSLKYLENTIFPPDDRALARWHLAILYRDMNEAKFRDIPKSTIHELVQKAQEIFEKFSIYYDKQLADKLLKS